MTYEISKKFSWAYGHRVHSQRLNTEYSLDDACICRFMHGHQAEVAVYLKSDTLNLGMVTDFKHLNWVKKLTDDHLDHKFVLDLNDPWFANIINGTVMFDDNGHPQQLLVNRPLNTSSSTSLNVNKVFVPGTEFLLGYSLDVDELQGPEREFFEGFFMISVVPTSENLAKLLFDAIDVKMAKIDIQVSRVEWMETPKSKATYSRP